MDLCTINFQLDSDPDASFARPLSFYVFDIVEDHDTTWEWITQSIKDASKQ